MREALPCVVVQIRIRLRQLHTIAPILTRHQDNALSRPVVAECLERLRKLAIVSESKINFAI